MNRIDRLSAILIQLQSKRIVKASEIADRFNISLRTVYRDIRALEEAGVPLVSEAGKGYYLVDGYNLPPVMLTKEEAGAMLVAEKLMQNFGDRSLYPHFDSAAYKIRSVLPESQKEFLEKINEQIAIYNKPTVQENFPNNFMAEIQEALANRRCIEIEYFTQGRREWNTRRIEPIGMLFYGSNWHLIAYCKERMDYRDFRIDRVREMKILPFEVKHTDGIEIREYLKTKWEQNELHEVVIHFDKDSIGMLSTTKYYFGFVDEEVLKDSVRMVFATNDMNYLAQWLLSYGELVLKVETNALLEKMKSIVQKLRMQYL